MGCLLEISIKKNDEEPGKTLARLVRHKSLTGATFFDSEEKEMSYSVRVYALVDQNMCSDLCCEIRDKWAAVKHAKIIS